MAKTKEEKNAYARDWRARNPPYVYSEEQKARRRELQRVRRKTDEYREKKNKQRRERYATDAEYREACKAGARNENLTPQQIADKNDRSRRYYADNTAALKSYQRDYRAGLSEEDKSRILEQQRERRQIRLEEDTTGVRSQQFASRIRNKYGLTESEWWGLFDEQGCACAICGITQPMGKGWHVDHCHDSERVRGILCMRCNTGLGAFQDSAEVLRKAAAYLDDASCPLPERSDVPEASECD